MLHDKASNAAATGQTASVPLQVTTADVVPPNFTASTPLVTSAHETDFTLLVQLNKSSCTVYFSVMLATAPQPSIDSVLAGTAPGNLVNGTFLAPTVSLLFVSRSALPCVCRCTICVQPVCNALESTRST